MGHYKRLLRLRVTFSHCFHQLMSKLYKVSFKHVYSSQLLELGKSFPRYLNRIWQWQSHSFLCLHPMHSAPSLQEGVGMKNQCPAFCTSDIFCVLTELLHWKKCNSDDFVTFFIESFLPFYTVYSRSYQKIPPSAFMKKISQILHYSENLLLIFFASLPKKWAFTNYVCKEGGFVNCKLYYISLM